MRRLRGNRCSIQSPPAFSQALVVNGNAISETDTGDYYPYRLYQVVTAVFDPVPFAAQLEQTKQEIAEPSGGSNNQVCGDLHFRVDRIMVCFDGSGRLESVFTKGYNAQFKEYEKFGAKQVARRIVTAPEYKSEIHGVVTALDPLPQSQDGLKDAAGGPVFEVKTLTPAADRIRILRISEDAMRGLVIGDTDITWPTVVAVWIQADAARSYRRTAPGTFAKCSPRLRQSRPLPVHGQFVRRCLRNLFCSFPVWTQGAVHAKDYLWRRD